MIRTAVQLLLPLLLAACAPRGAAPPGALVVPEDAEEALGQRVYALRCHSCHPDGHAGLGPSVLTPPHFLVPVQVRLGLGAMPAFHRDVVSREQLRALRRWVARVDREDASR